MSGRNDGAPGGRLPRKTKTKFEFAFGESEIGLFWDSQFIMDKLWASGVRPSCLQQRAAGPDDDVIVLPRRRSRTRQ